ncbi:Hypothetical predicted protein, partial [Marmota monax]
MVEKRQQNLADIEQNVTELLPRNPYCPNEGMHCGCRLHNVPLQTPVVTAKPCSLWKTFLVCLLACLIAAAIVILVLYFGHFGNPTSYPTIVINADGKPSQIICFPGTAPPLTSSPLPGSQSTSSSTPVTSQGSSATTSLTSSPLPGSQSTSSTPVTSQGSTATTPLSSSPLPGSQSTSSSTPVTSQGSSATTSLTSSPLPGSQSTSSTPVTSQGSSATTPLSSSPLPGSQSTSSSTPVTSQGSSATVPTPMKTTEHEVEIED